MKTGLASPIPVAAAGVLAAKTMGKRSVHSCFVDLFLLKTGGNL